MRAITTRWYLEGEWRAWARGDPWVTSASAPAQFPGLCTRRWEVTLGHLPRPWFDLKKEKERKERKERREREREKERKERKERRERERERKEGRKKEGTLYSIYGQRGLPLLQNGHQC